MPNFVTRKFENAAKEELLAAIGEYIATGPGIGNPLLEEEFGIGDTGKLAELPFSQLQKIADFVVGVFLF